jgi:hypothetical protein
MEVDQRTVRAEFEASTVTERELRDVVTRKHTDAAETDDSIGFSKKGVEAKVADIRKRLREEARESQVSDRFGHVVFHIRTGGGPASPFWVFEPPHGEQHLAGVNSQRDWGELSYDDLPATLEAQVRVAPDDVHVEGVGGIWPRQMSPRKQRVFRWFALRQVSFNPYLSKVSLTIFQPFDKEARNAA